MLLYHILSEYTAHTSNVAMGAGDAKKLKEWKDMKTILYKIQKSTNEKSAPAPKPADGSTFQVYGEDQPTPTNSDAILVAPLSCLLPIIQACTD